MASAAEQMPKCCKRKTNHKAQAMQHKVFNEKENIKWLRTERRKNVFSFQGGRENDPSVSGMRSPDGMMHGLQQMKLLGGRGRHSPEPPRPREPPEEMGTPAELRELPTAADREDPTAVL